MVIDPKKISLVEKDIENYLWENPTEVRGYGWHVAGWVKRQFALPSGILDLWGITNRGHWIVVEVKNVEVDAKAIVQVCRYAFDLQHIIATADAPRDKWAGDMCMKVVVGPSIGTQTLRECEACDVSYIEFDVEFTVDLSPVGWTDEFRESRNEEYEKLAQDDLLRDALDWCIQTQERFREMNPIGTEQDDEGDESEDESEDDGAVCPF